MIFAKGKILQRNNFRANYALFGMLMWCIGRYLTKHTYAMLGTYLYILSRYIYKYVYDDNNYDTMYMCKWKFKGYFSRVSKSIFIWVYYCKMESA